MKIAGFDFGNRYLKFAEDGRKDELIAAYREITEDEYTSLEVNEDMEKVKYEGRYFVVGLTGEEGITEENKGDESVIEMSNMLKYTMLARSLREAEQNDGEFRIVTGTPYDDFHMAPDYIKLMNGSGSIELAGEEFKTAVKGTYVTKQGACVSITLPDRKKENYIIWDWGGGTLDISVYEKGVRTGGTTMSCSLNRMFEELGRVLIKNKLKIERPDLDDTLFIKDMENLKLNGDYRGIQTTTVDGEIINLKNLASDWFQKKIDKVISDGVNKLRISEVKLQSFKNVHIGGGAKLLKEEIVKNSQLSDSSMGEEPEYRNVLAYLKIGNKIKGSEDKWQ